MRRSWSLAWDGWNAEQNDALRALAGTMPVSMVAAALSERFSVPRTSAAVRMRAKRLGISLWVKAWSLRDVVILFGVDHRTIVSWWLEHGLLAATRWDGRGPHGGWWITFEALERFVRQHSYAFDWRRMRPEQLCVERRGEGRRLASLAELLDRADPWRPYGELVAFVGIRRTNLDRWRRQGLVPCRRRSGAGEKGEIVVQGRQFGAIRDAVHAAQAAAIQDGIVRSLVERRRRAGITGVPYAVAALDGQWREVCRGDGWTGWRLERVNGMESIQREANQ